MPRGPDEFLFFWTTKHINGWASQWFPAAFTVELDMDGTSQKITFPSTEHWMMLQKAMLFGDTAIAKEVLTVMGTSRADLTYVKSLGRQVKNFDEEIWKLHRERIVFEGNMHKFMQNADIREKLLETGTKIIVEASPRDRIWGIGYGEKTALVKSTKEWGLNLLGKALVDVREELRKPGDASGASEGLFQATDPGQNVSKECALN